MADNPTLKDAFNITKFGIDATVTIHKFGKCIRIKDCHGNKAYCARVAIPGESVKILEIQFSTARDAIYMADYMMGK